MTCLGRYDALSTARLIADWRAFWELVHTVASTLDDLAFDYPHELPLPEP